jgi:hypothetical protein
MKNTDTCINVCNSLLRGEISAVETYNQAIEKFAGSREAEMLDSFRNDHQKSVRELSEHVSEMGGVPEAESGAWGAFAKAVEGAAKLFGGSPAIKALIQGEEHGIREYEEALSNPDVMEGAKLSIRVNLLPRLHDHVAALESLPADEGHDQPSSDERINESIDESFPASDPPSWNSGVTPERSRQTSDDPGGGRDAQ